MQLTIDIGNSSAKLVVFEADTIRQRLQMPTLQLDNLQRLFREYDIQAAILSSVSEDYPTIQHWLNENTFFIELNHLTPLPIQNLYETPKTLGKDRIAAAVGANALYPFTQLFGGRCSTPVSLTEFIDASKLSRGSISPGIDMRMKAMHDYTARLPLIQKQRLDSFVGSNTETAMRTGAQYGATLELEGFLKRYEQLYGSVQLMMTGGDAEIIAESLQVNTFIINKDLVLIGLNKILEYNANLLEK